MRILLDECVPRRLKRSFRDHELVLTVPEAGFSCLKNGELLRRIVGKFDLLITTDQALRTQQNLAGRRLAILVLPFASWLRLEANAEKIALRVANLRPGEYVEIAVD